MMADPMMQRSVLESIPLASAGVMASSAGVMASSAGVMATSAGVMASSAGSTLEARIGSVSPALPALHPVSLYRESSPQCQSAMVVSQMADGEVGLPEDSLET